MEMASLVKKKPAVGVKVKREKNDEQEADAESPQKESTEMDDLWLQVKMEIDEEMEQKMRLSSVHIDDMHGVRIKEEFADKSHPDFKSFQRQFLCWEDDEMVERAQQKSNNARNGQSIDQPEKTLVAKRRRLTRRDWLKTPQGEVGTHSVKKEPAVGMQVKRERIDEREGSVESPQKESTQTDDLWLQVVRKEINKQFSAESTSASCATGTAMKTQAGDGTVPQTALKPSSFDMEEAAKSDDQEESPQDSGSAERSSMEAFASQAATWLRGLPLDSLDRDLNAEERKVRGLDCMKMWPWMRDLPTCVWAGRGWAFDENGLRRLSSTGGSAAMQGVELFESVGAAEVAASGEKINKTAVPASAAETAAPPEGLKPIQFKRHNLVKQSGVPNVYWNISGAWEVGFPTFDSKGKKIGKTNRKFAVKKFLVPGRSEIEADAEALEAAKAFRAELVLRGVLSEPKPRDPNFTSEVPGVAWHQGKQKWEVGIVQKGGKKKIYGGCFTKKAAAEAKALELREQHGLERQVTAVSTLAELPMFHPKVPYPGVIWSQAEQQWHAKCIVGGAQRNFRIKPKDHSEEELERSFKVAVAWKKKQEKEREKAWKPEAPPAKKQRK